MTCLQCGAESPEPSERCPVCGSPSRLEDLDTQWHDAPTPTAEREPLLLGQVLAGRYALVDVLGEGAMGRVYRAEDALLGEDVAIKLLRKELLQDARMVEVFKQEILTARRISHPRVTRIHDLGEDAGRLFISMELLTGGTLADWIARRSRAATIAETLPQAVAVAEGLAAVHGAGIVHRDVKPQNFLFDGSRPRIADFGLARLLSQKRKGAGVLGTPLYMCPEAWLEEEVGFPGDVYSLGAVLFELFTGRPPFRARSILELQSAHTQRESPRARSLRDDIPELLDRAIARALSKRPEERYAHAGDLVQTLVALADALDIPIDAGIPSSAFVRAHPRNFSLPTPTSVFIGRETELEDIERLIEGRKKRCVTLLGPGGIGKTRIALHYAAQARPRYEGGVWFCDLTEARSALAAATIVARTLHVPLTDNDPPTRLADALASRPDMLLLLDNAEHTATDLAPLLDTWLERAPSLRVLLTSRILTRARGEVAYEVGPMSLPQHGSYSEAVNLFLERAEDIRPDVAFTAHDVDTIGEIVTQLEGLPLAIELAVARTRALSLAELRDRLGSGLEVLTTSGRWSGDPRHATVRRTLDWSWELLSPIEQAAFTQCSVFRGGFTLDAAEAVLDVGEASTLDVLESLIEQSMLRTETIDGRARFALYELVREYAADQLARLGQSHTYAERHARWFLERAESWARGAYAHGGAERIQQLVDEQENLAAIHARMLALPEPDGGRALRAALALEPVAWTRGPVQPFGEAITATLDAGVEDAELRAWGLIRRARVERRLGRLEESRADLETALTLAEPGSRAEGWARVVLGGTLDSLRESGAADEELRRVVEIARSCGDARLEGHALGLRGIVAYRAGDTSRARHLYEQAIKILEGVGDETAVGIHYGNLGSLLLDRREHAAARRALEAALRLHRAVGDRQSEGYALGMLGVLAHDLGDPTTALHLYDRAISTLQPVGYRRGEALFLGYRGLLLLATGQLADAQTSFRAAVNILGRNTPSSLLGLFEAGLGVTLERAGQADLAHERFQRAAELGAASDASSPRRRAIEVLARVRGQSATPPSGENDFELRFVWRVLRAG